MIESNEKNEIKQTITVLAISSCGNSALHLKPDSTLKDFLIEAKKSFKYDYEFATVGPVNVNKIFTKSDLNLKLSEIGVVNDSGIKINICDKKTKNAINLKDLESKKVEEKKAIVMEKSSWPLLKIIIGTIDLFLLAAAVTTSLLFFFSSLSFSIMWPIVLTVLFVSGAVLFFWIGNYIAKKSAEKINFETNSNEKNEDMIENIEEISKNKEVNNLELEEKQGENKTRQDE